MELLSKTTVSTKAQGDGLTAKDVNSINDVLNNLVDVANMYLKKYCDINLESNNNAAEYEFEEAVLLVPESRRSTGMKIKFRGVDGIFYEYVYTSESLTETSWKNKDNWNPVMTIIDGGEW